MDQLAYELKWLSRQCREGSFATRANREDMLIAMAAELKAAGFKLPGPGSLKPKHVDELVERWRANGISQATMANRLAVLRWWARKVGKAPVVRRSNADYGLGESLTKARAYTLDAERLAAVPCPLVRLSLELQAAFGLRREESIKVRVAIADKGGTLVLRPSWTKGGRGRSVPIVSAEQRALLDRIKATVGDRALIPDGKSYVQQLKVYEHQTLNAGLRNTHGLRHAWAQERYRVLTGWSAPAAGGPMVAVMDASGVKADRRARMQLSQELGHNRIEITRVYLG